MSFLDWLVLFSTIALITGYGIWQIRRRHNADNYLMSRTDNWVTIGLSVMATQASAVTFISTPGQAFEKGMGFVQFYLGVPIALVILCITFLPNYFRLRVSTAYEFLEKRFDLKTRLLASGIFLLQRGLSAGITLYAPAIILSTVLHWNLPLTILLMGSFVIIYTVFGGTKAVNITDRQQMLVIFLGLFLAFFILLRQISVRMPLAQAIRLAGDMHRMNILDTTFSFDNQHRYTLWSGLLGSVFLFMSYYGTDQSQVQRYLSGKSLTESRLGLIFNALFKIPMQFFILFTGVMMFVFFQLEKPPLLFNQTALQSLRLSSRQAEIKSLEADFRQKFEEKQMQINQLSEGLKVHNEALVQVKRQNINYLEKQMKHLREEARELMKTTGSAHAKTRDADYVFLYFILNYLPTGVVGLLFAVIFCAAWASTSGELNALSTAATLDFYKRLVINEASPEHYRSVSQIFTIFWGILAMSFALLANLLDSLIEAVNLIGSLFYGTILGIFLVAFYLKQVGSRAVFVAALAGQTLIFALFFTLREEIGFLWYNAIACGSVVGLAWGLHSLRFPDKFPNV
jgi:solute:Na+ symporter, SSS family